MQDRGLQVGGRVQKYIDSEVIRLMASYTPKESGALIDSAEKLTDIGSGEVKQGGKSVPYARKLYYYEKSLGARGVRWSGGAPRGSYWFDRMKNEGGAKAILRGAIREAGAKR